MSIETTSTAMITTTHKRQAQNKYPIYTIYKTTVCILLHTLEQCHCRHINILQCYFPFFASFDDKVSPRLFATKIDMLQKIVVRFSYLFVHLRYFGRNSSGYYGSAIPQLLMLLNLNVLWMNPQM